ncbi:MAG: peptidyl-prolyl cis-trans isomerase [Myxococcota bacterium]|nr:peptidylprolyl isomerase [Deltaproteobacteria bacterium]MDQ3340336.1 peptidyl-prolyl cis-trans isomerase [Myxococcota bacterium]
MQRFLLFAVVALCFACQKVDKDKAGAGSGSQGAAPVSGLESKDILARTTTSPEVAVKHVLIGWKDLAAAYRGGMDSRAQARSQQDAEKLTKEVFAKMKAKPADIDALVKQHSEDPGSLKGEPYVIKADTPFVPEFKNLAMRLELNEAGIVKTTYGYHVMLRVPPPPPPPLDPLESADILARPAPTEKITAHVQHVLISIAGGARAAPDAPTKAEADKIAKDVFEKAKAGTDMKELMKQFSKDPGSANSGKAYPVTAGSGMIPPFENLSLRLKEGEVGLVKTDFGWHVIKRVPPPPPPAPDPLDSVDILKREMKTQKASVKHILLGWTEVHATDERGKKRSRKDLEKLVKDTVAKLKKGEKIDKLMAELSEDEGSAKTGQAYPVTPDAGLVPPFKDLSLRLDVNEVGVVKTDFGIHIIQRIE